MKKLSYTLPKMKRMNLPGLNTDMKPVLLTTIAMIYTIAFVNAQGNGIENEIRQLDEAEAAAVVKHDTIALERMWADDFTVNTPYNFVGTRNRGDKINLYYSKLERNIEKLIIYNDSLVMTMGNEVVNRKAPMTLAGQTITRRFTHMWMKRNGTWQLAVRHANFICPDMPEKKLR
jgi:ketosteroid isomerase-like protein